MTAIGYTTDFYGSFKIDRPVDDDTYNLLVGLSNTRRMKRSPQRLAKRLKLTTKEVRAKYGEECEFWVGDTHNLGQDKTDDVMNQTMPPASQPSLWCQWAIAEDRQTIAWDENEKFYEYTEWLKYIIERILKPRGYILSGSVDWTGEETGDQGVLEVDDNEIVIKEAITFFVTAKDAVRVTKIVNDYLQNPLKEVIDHKLDA